MKSNKRFFLLCSYALFLPALALASIDLHSHSYCSDGIKNPETIVQEAKDAGVSYLALTDHDTSACSARAKAKAEQLGLQFIPGIEISAEDDSVHILGLSINPSNDGFALLAASAKADRIARTNSILDKLSSLGVPLDLLSDVLMPKLNRERRADGKPEMTLDEARAIPIEKIYDEFAGQITRPDIARAMIAKGYVKNNREAFDQYLANPDKAEVPMKGPSFRDAIALIHRAGGIAILAHPYTIFKFKKFPISYSGKSYPDFENFADDLLAAGLDGFEYFRPGMEKSPEDAARVNQIATSYFQKTGRTLFLTPGSDYHGGKESGIGPETLLKTPMPEADAAVLLRALGH